MNIVFVNSTHRWGGVKSWTLDFAKALMRRDHSVTIFGRSGPFVDKAEELGLNARSLSFGPDFNPVAIWKFFHFFIKFRADAVIVNVSKDLRTAGIAARLRNIPVVHRIGLPGDVTRKAKVRLLHEWIKPRYLVPCDYIKEGFLKNLPFVRPHEVTVIHSAKTIPPGPPRKLHHPLSFVTTSQLNPDKGHLQVLRILADLRNQGFDFIWHVAGTGRDENLLKAETRKLGLHSMVKWHGFQSDIVTILSQGDVFILPSSKEGLPNTLLEAMAQGLVPVAYDVGGIPEAWPQKLGELLVPFEQGPDGLHKALKNALSASPDQLLEWQKASWQTAEKRFNIDRNVCTLEQWIAALTSSTTE